MTFWEAGGRHPSLDLTTTSWSESQAGLASFFILPLVLLALDCRYD